MSEYEVVREWLDQGGSVSHGGKFTSPKVYRELDLSLQREVALRSQVEIMQHNYASAVAELKTDRKRLRSRVEELKAALRAAHAHLLFNAWRDDPEGDKRHVAVQEAVAALAADTPPSKTVDEHTETRS